MAEKQDGKKEWYEYGEDWSTHSGDKEAYAEMLREEFEASRKQLGIEDPKEGVERNEGSTTSSDIWDYVERNQGSITSSDGPRVLSEEYVDYTNDLSPRSSDWAAVEAFYREEEAIMDELYSLLEVERGIGRLSTNPVPEVASSESTNPVPHVASSEANIRELRGKVRQLEERVGDLEQKNMELEMRLGFLERFVL